MHVCLLFDESRNRIINEPRIVKAVLRSAEALAATWAKIGAREHIPNAVP